MKAFIEITDIYCGEANYSWVKRFEFDIKENASDMAIIRKAKKVSEWCIGAKHEKQSTGDYLTIKPYGVNQIMFISFDS